VNPAIYFSPDGYALDGPKLMGRQAAGNGFLRAAVKARGDDPLVAYVLSQADANAFAAMVTALDPAATTRVIGANRLEEVAKVGLLYRPDQVLGGVARQRLRAGPAAYSLCGVTHTIATQASMTSTVDMLTAPLTSWDAVVCTSTVAADSLRIMIEAQQEYLSWRLRQPVAPTIPQLPVIPLGVHCDDFDISDADRATARATLAIEADEVVALFAGRLTFSGKAHPHPMYAVLQQVAQETGRRIVLIQAGQFVNSATEDAFRTATAAFCPDVRALFVDGKDTQLYRAAWRAGDVFVSLSDNIQETFGLTPLEAMAAGMPVLVSDWNGYKDTVRDGVDGYRVKTWSPGPPVGFVMARDYEAEVNNYDTYLSRTSTTVSCAWPELLAAATTLVTDAAARRTMGEAARRHAREVFDWSVVYAQYQALWAELAAIRTHALQDPDQRAWLEAAPRVAPNGMDPYKVFAGYPTATIMPDTLLIRAPHASVELYGTMTAHTMTGFWKSPPEHVERLLRLLDAGPLSVQAAADALRLPILGVIEMTARLAKLGLLEFRAPEAVT
jgi:starch synthase